MYTTKAIFAVILALVMVAIPLAITEQVDAAGDDYDKLTFVVDGQGYETLSAAIDSIQTSGTVTVQVSRKERVQQMQPVRRFRKARMSRSISTAAQSH